MCQEVALHVPNVISSHNRTESGDIINANVVGSGTILRASEDYVFTHYVEDVNNPDMMDNEAILDYEIEEDIVLYEVMQNETIQNEELIVTE